VDSFTALADPTRRQILELLSRGDHAAGEIAERFAVSAPAISQHLKVLREARLVRARIDGQRRIYSLDPAGFAEVDAWMHQVRQFWSARLDGLPTRHGEPDN
jgi:DNA-binding transcriptional ArsR family regulator